METRFSGFESKLATGIEPKLTATFETILESKFNSVVDRCDWLLDQNAQEIKAAREDVRNVVTQLRLKEFGKTSREEEDIEVASSNKHTLVHSRGKTVQTEAIPESYEQFNRENLPVNHLHDQIVVILNNLHDPYMRKRVLVNNLHNNVNDDWRNVRGGRDNMPCGSESDMVQNEARFGTFVL